MVEHGGGPVLLWDCKGWKSSLCEKHHGFFEVSGILAKILMISNDHQDSVCAPKASQSTRPNLVKGAVCKFFYSTKA